MRKAQQYYHLKITFFIFIPVLLAIFVFSGGAIRQAKALFMVFSHISDFSVSATTISYDQEQDGYVCIKAYPYIPEYVDPEYPDDPPSSFIDYNYPTNIYSGSMELAGPKNVLWQGKDRYGNTVGAGWYIFEAMIYSSSNCGGSPISYYAEQKEFQISAPEPPQSWSFAIISDLHVGQPELDYGNLTWDDNISGDDDIASVENLKNTVEVINSNRQKYNLEFVVVDGDFTDSAELSELSKAKEILDTLNVPWVPIIGNHDIWPYYGEKWKLVGREDEMAPENVGELGTDRFFYEIFKSQYEKLETVFPGLAKEEDKIWNPETDPNHYSLFQNFSFDYNGYHFIGLDFNDRDNEIYPLKGAAAEGNLHNFSGGTWDWLSQDLSQYVNEHPESSENIILLAHHPFRKAYEQVVYNLGFSDKELGIIRADLENYKNNITALFAGHTHKNKDYSFSGDTLEVIETAANVDGPLARLVQFLPDGRIDYSKMLPEKGMTITAHSPVDLEVTDPSGLIINKQSNGIAGANYFEEDIDGDGESEDLIEIIERKEGDYRIRVIPEAGAAPDSTYSLDVSLLEDNFGYTPIILAQNVPVSQIPAEAYILQPKERIATSLSYGGNISGQYSDSVNLSATLKNASGGPLAGKKIVFEIGEQIISAITDSGGVASASLVLSQIPGKYYSIEANFVGDEDYLPSFDPNDFEILKEDATVNVPEKDGFAFDKIILSAEIKDGDGQTFLQESAVEFKINNRSLGIVEIGEEGIATSSWAVDLIPEELTENYPVEVIFSGNDYYQPAQGQANFVLKSAKWLKQDAMLKLDAVETGDKKLKLDIQAAKKSVQESIDDNLWIDSSHIVFFNKECFEKNQIDIEFEERDMEELFEIGKTAGLGQKCFRPKSGLKVFSDEHLAVKRLQSRIFGKPKISPEMKDVFNEIIGQLVKADELLAKIVIYEAETVSVENPKIQKKIERQIEKAKERLMKAQEYLSKNRPEKAIADFANSWLHAQMALKLAKN